MVIARNVGAAAARAIVRRPRIDLVRSDRASPPKAVEDPEAYAELVSRAHKKFGKVPDELIARHILAVTPGADWPVQREALAALTRRQEFARRDDIRVAARPAGGAAFGIYGTASRGSGRKPYTTVLESLVPPRGSCDCPDYLRGSLGLCKHLLTVIDDLAQRPRAWKRAVAAQVNVNQDAAPRLCWNPVRPLTGAGDWLARVAWIADGKPNASPPGWLGWFREDADGRFVLKTTHVDDPARRLDLLGGLQLAMRELARRGCADVPRVDPALRRRVEVEEKRLQRLLQGSLDARALKRGFQTMKLPLYPYQEEGVKRFLEVGRLLLADDMGLGKTAQAIACCHVLWHAGRVRRGLLIVPAALKPQWLREWQLFTDVPAAVIEGGAEDRARLIRSTKAGFLIGNYEQLLRDLGPVHAWRPDMVVLDEAQRIKNWESKTSAYVKRLDAAYRLVLTGTPMENRIDELASIMDWVDDDALEPKWRLVPWHATYVDGVQEVAGARHLDTLRSRLAHCMVRRVRQEVLRQLPPRRDTRVPVEMTAEQATVHAEFDLPIMALVSISKKRPLTRAEFLRLMQLLTNQRVISNGAAQFEFEDYWPGLSKVERPTEGYLKTLSTPKLLEMRELIRSLVVEQGRKVVVFSQWLRMLKLVQWAVREILDQAGLRSLYFSGEEGQKRRTQNVIDFHDDPKARVLFATDAGGVGLNLQRAANAVINIEVPWNPAVLEQRIGRIYRLGQKLPIDVYNLVSEPSIEARIFQLVGTKKAFFKGLFDGDTSEVRFDGSGSILSRLERIVDAAKAPELPADAPAMGDLDDPAVLGTEDDDRDEVAIDRTPVALPASLPPAAGPQPTAPLAEAFERVQIRRTEAGSMVIEAPPEAASTLAALFESMAKLMRAAAGD